MIIDTSVPAAILFREPDAELLGRIILSADIRLILAANLFEAMMVIEGRLGPDGAGRLDALLKRLEIRTAPVMESHAHVAREAWRRFGKARHPARLNYGDCFSYALAISKNLPLLYKGNDFDKTDVLSALSQYIQDR